MDWSKYESIILNQLDSFSLDEIEQGINELERKIDKVLLGNCFKEQLMILYTLRKQAKHKIVAIEVSFLKDSLLNEWLTTTDIKEARVRVNHQWLKYQNQLQGIEFVRDGLKYELEQLQLVGVSE